MGLGGETFASLDVVYGRTAHIYGLQSRRDKKNVIVGDKRKDFNARGSQGNFKKNRNGNGNFKWRNGQVFNDKVQSKMSYKCKKCNKNHLVETVKEI